MLYKFAIGQVVKIARGLYARRNESGTVVTRRSDFVQLRLSDGTVTGWMPVKDLEG